MASQIKRDDRLHNADDVLNNNSNELTRIKAQVNALHNTYFNYSKLI